MVWSEVKNQQSEDDALTDIKIGLPYITVATAMILIIAICVMRQKRQNSDQRCNHADLWDENYELMNPKMFGNSVDQIKNPTKSDTVELDAPVDKDASCNDTTITTQAISFANKDNKENSTDLLRTSVEVIPCDVTIETCSLENNNVQYQDYEVIDYPSTDVKLHKLTTVISDELKDTNKAYGDIVSSGDVNIGAGSIGSQHVCEPFLQDSIEPLTTSTANAEGAQSDLTNSPSSTNLPYIPTNSSSSSANSHSYPTNSLSSPTDLPHSPADIPSSPANSLFSPSLRSIDLVAIYIPSDDDDDDSNMSIIANPPLVCTATDQNAHNVMEIEMNDNKQLECHVPTKESEAIYACQEIQSCKEIVEVHSLSDDMSSPTENFDRTDARPTSDPSPDNTLELALEQETPQKSYLISFNIPHEDKGGTDIIPIAEPSSVVSASDNSLELSLEQEATPQKSYLVSVDIPHEDKRSTDIPIVDSEPSSVVSASDNSLELPLEQEATPQKSYLVSVDIPHEDKRSTDIPIVDSEPSSVVSASDNTLKLRQEMTSKESYLVSIDIQHEDKGSTDIISIVDSEPSSVVSASDNTLKLRQEMTSKESYLVSIDIQHEDKGSTDVIPAEEPSSFVSNSDNTLELPVRQEITSKESYLVSVSIPHKDRGNTDVMPTEEPSSVVSDANNVPKLPVKQRLATQKPHSVAIYIPHKDSGDIPTEKTSSVVSDSGNTLELPVRQEITSKAPYLVSFNIPHEGGGSSDIIYTQTAEPSSVFNDSDDIMPKLPVKQKLATRKEYTAIIDIPYKNNGAVPSLVKDVATCDFSCDDTITLQENPAYVTISDVCTSGTSDDAIELQRNPAYIPIKHISSRVYLYEEISFTSSPITGNTSDTTIKMEKNPAYHWTTINPAESLS